MTQLHEPFTIDTTTTPSDEAPQAAASVEPARTAIWRAIGTGLSAGLLAIIIGLALVTIIIPRASGATALTVLTGSMEPKLPPGTMLVVKPKPIDQIRIGDVVTYEPNPNDSTTVISHRVIGITTNPDGTRTFTVKGDANPAPDAPVQSKQVVAVLWYSLPWLGWVSNYVGGTTSAWAIPIAAGLLLIYALWNFVAGAVEQRRKRVRARRAR